MINSGVLIGVIMLAVVSQALYGLWGKRHPDAFWLLVFIVVIGIAIYIGIMTVLP